MSSFTTLSEIDDAPIADERQLRVRSSWKPSIRFDGVFVIGLTSMGLALVTASECQSITHLPSLIYGFALWGWWGCIAGAFWRLGRRAPVVLGFTPRTITIHLMLACLLGITHLLLLWSLIFTPAGWQGSETADSVWKSLMSINRFGIELLIYGFVFGITGIIQFQIRVQRDAMKSLELQRQLSAAQLRALQMQLEPHFLFNTLNAITALVELGRQEKAAQMLFHLNAILKSTLKRSTPEKVPLVQELEIVENYLAIEQVRFADRLQIEIKVEPDALDGLVPCFLLQPIVENAIRHGIANCEDEGLVEAVARRDGRSLQLRVRNSGGGLMGQRQNGSGIGLSNTRERLTHFYRDDFSMKAEALDAGGFQVAITIPYERR
jgi:hypothetical protein